ncbi:MAG: DinB family protein [Candidatus Eisenbacteria bacterium]
MSDRHLDFPHALAIHPTAFVAPGAIVVGEVAVGANASIWFNTVARGDSERIAIGAGTNVQDNSVVHVDEGMPALVGDRVTVGHRAIVHGCVVEDDVLIGMGAVVLSGATIGTGSLIGAGALVKEGQVIPPGSLALGAPARVIGPVSDAHREAIRVGAVHYAELSRAYLKRGVEAVRTSPVQHLPVALAGMTWLEWEQRLDALRGGPDWAAAQLEAFGEAHFARRPREGAWSAAEVLQHLRDTDAHVMRARLAHVLAEDFPAVAAASLQTGAYPAQPAAAALAEWRAERREAMRALESLRADAWRRPFVHPRLGPLTLADHVRMWSEHDLSHRRQVRAALEATT